MTKKTSCSKKVVTPMEHTHSDFFKKIDQLYDALNNLHYEGKVSYGKNIKAIDEVVKYFNAEVYPHIKFEEDVVFTFLDIHVPRLDPTLRFLKADHKEFKANLKTFEALFGKFKTEKNDLKRNRIKEKLRDKGIYIIFLMRNHIQLEDESIYQAINKELHADEKKLFLKLMKGKR